MLNINESSERPAGIWELRCNMDDMTGEQMGFAMEMLMEQGALDVFSTPITMKKSRPGILLTVICNEADKEKMVRLIFKHTSLKEVNGSIIECAGVPKKAEDTHSGILCFLSRCGREGTRKIKCGADEGRRRGLDRAEP